MAKKEKNTKGMNDVVSEVILPIVTINSETAASIIKSTISHILFMREQIPDTIATLRLNVDQVSVAGVKAARKLHSVSKFLNGFDEVQGAVVRICVETTLQEVQILIGATVTSPRELYVLHFPGRDQWDQGKQISERVRNECCRRLVREMVGKWTEVYSHYSPPVATNSYISLLPHVTPASNLGGGDAATSFTPQGVFMTREGFKPSLRRKAPPVYHLYLRTRAEPLPMGEECPPPPPLSPSPLPVAANRDHNNVLFRLLNPPKAVTVGGVNEISDSAPMEEGCTQAERSADDAVANDHSSAEPLESAQVAVWMVQTRGVRGIRNI